MNSRVESPAAVRAAPASPLKLFLSEFAESRVALVAVALLALIVLLALAAPLITPQNPYDLAKLVLMDARRPPGFVGSNGFTHWLGTDAQGRDLYSAILYGLRISLQVGLVAGTIAFTLGAGLGTLAGFIGGRVEAFIMRPQRVEHLSARAARCAGPGVRPSAADTDQASAGTGSQGSNTASTAPLPWPAGRLPAWMSPP